jgi:hypothetical protein
MHKNNSHELYHSTMSSRVAANATPIALTKSSGDNELDALRSCARVGPHVTVTDSPTSGCGHPIPSSKSSNGVNVPSESSSNSESGDDVREEYDDAGIRVYGTYNHLGSPI